MVIEHLGFLGIRGEVEHEHGPNLTKFYLHEELSN